MDTGIVTPGRSTPHAIRLTGHFNNPSGFKFSISRKSAFEKLMDTVTMTSGHYGLPKFEHDFIIHTNDKEAMKNLLSNPQITGDLTRIPFESLGISEAHEQQTASAPGAGEISLKMPGEIGEFLQDSRRLTSLLGLFKEILNQISLVPAAH